MGYATFLIHKVKKRDNGVDANANLLIPIVKKTHKIKLIVAMDFRSQGEMSFN